MGHSFVCPATACDRRCCRHRGLFHRTNRRSHCEPAAGDMDRSILDLPGPVLADDPARGRGPDSSACDHVDQAAYVIFLLVTNAACASIIAIGFVMGDVKSMDFWPKALHVGLAIAALLLSWMLIQTVFAFHYARRYYAPASVREGPAAGLSFPGVEEPAYFDFAYYSFVVGMTSQVSDVSVYDCADAAHDAGPQHPQLHFQHRRARDEHQCHRRRHLDSAEPDRNAAIAHIQIATATATLR